MIRRREDILAEEERLAPYACRSAYSRGREYPLDNDPLRTDFQRDRDRILHSTAFRKLEFKTQVFRPSAGDYHRTRLTHTMEVAQIARTLARTLNLNTDLSEAIALAHDLGHTPCGHAGEEAMQECMAEHGGFEHNAQGLRVVEFLEERYQAHRGMNLTYEVREGIIKHDTEYDSPTVTDRFFPTERATLESQVVDLADEIAYNCADLDDALKLRYIAESDLRDIPWLYVYFEESRAAAGGDVRPKFVRYHAIGKLYDQHIYNALEETDRRLKKYDINSLEKVRQAPDRLADFSAEFKDQLRQLKSFLLRRVYLHPKTFLDSERGRRFITELFAAYLRRPQLMPFKYQKRIEAEGIHRVTCDYISGMTDRFLHEQYKALFYSDI